MKEILIKAYEALDGTRFDSQDDCQKYELIESAKTIVNYCIGTTDCCNCVFRIEDSDVCKLANIPQAWNLPAWNLPAHGVAKDLEK